MEGGVASKGRRAVVGIEEWLVVTNRVGCRRSLEMGYNWADLNGSF